MSTIDSEPRVGEERSFGELVTQLTRDVSELVRQEAALAKREVGEKLGAAWTAASSAAVGGVICHVGVLALTAAIILLLAQAVPGWLSALIVGLVYLGVGAVLLKRGTARLHEVRLEPERMANSLRNDVEAIKEAVR